MVSFFPRWLYVHQRCMCNRLLYNTLYSCCCCLRVTLLRNRALGCSRADRIQVDRLFCKKPRLVVMYRSWRLLPDPGDSRSLYCARPPLLLLSDDGKCCCYYCAYKNIFYSPRAVHRKIFDLMMTFSTYEEKRLSLAFCLFYAVRLGHAHTRNKSANSPFFLLLLSNFLSHPVAARTRSKLL